MEALRERQVRDGDSQFFLGKSIFLLDFLGVVRGTVRLKPGLGVQPGGPKGPTGASAASSPTSFSSSGSLVRSTTAATCFPPSPWPICGFLAPPQTSVDSLRVHVVGASRGPTSLALLASSSPASSSSTSERCSSMVSCSSVLMETLPSPVVVLLTARWSFLLAGL